MPEETYTNDAALERAAIGRIMLIAESDEIPEDWHECDGSTQAAFRWPTFVARMGIMQSTFVIPKPERLGEGKRFIIKLGPRAAD